MLRRVPAIVRRASGLERAGDNTGAVVGPLFASVLVTVVSIRPAMLLAFIPGIFAAAAITFAAREANRSLGTATGHRTLSFNLRQLRQAGLARTLAPAGLFESGNVATTLLILCATCLLHADGRSLTTAGRVAVLMYAAHNAAATLAAAGGGHLIDRINAKVVFAFAAAVYIAVTCCSPWTSTRGRCCCSLSSSPG
jgi:hypothetical protein